MFTSKNKVGCLLLILLSISASDHGVLGARNLKKKVEYTKKPEGSVNIQDATVSRAVPSGPDPIHNRDLLENATKMF
ncbi:hypothetical protein NC652_012827 [Populus alba x Populus x berolinensis]|nr:hypothetical protein NC652_012823 [Populus alba x Populus x berolinensis]KAJ6928803.1 hypothetical protein NC652_012827 [Populus alba x Populus x berolinensis]KAJ6996033.1 hypothetical protein NC653_012807 [Populus alba x Populus x berolinensis]